MMNARIAESWRIPQMLAIGNNVKIVDGPFYGFEGTIKEVPPSDEKAHVTISIFGRPEIIELNLSQIKLATAN